MKLSQITGESEQSCSDPLQRLLYSRFFNCLQKEFYHRQPQDPEC